jgi:hypothetical protein
MAERKMMYQKQQTADSGQQARTSAIAKGDIIKESFT